jgi:hypothetical protein
MLLLLLPSGVSPEPDRSRPGLGDSAEARDAQEASP